MIICRRHLRDILYIHNIFKLYSNRLLCSNKYVISWKCSETGILRTKYNIKYPITFFSDNRDIFIMQNDPNLFGTKRKVLDSDIDLVDPDDIKEHQHIENPPNAKQKLTTQKYAKLIKEHFNNGRVKEALDVLEIRMLNEDGVEPEKYIYNLLISGCAKAGYSKKAFQLFNRMKQRGLNVSQSTYTSLFNCCANSPLREDALKKANNLREILLERGYTPNEYNFNAMIKAYGRLGDIQTAFLLADEMIHTGLKISITTINFLLQACASNSKCGFRYSLLVWQKIYKYKLSPDKYSFHLMLRCVRDCSIGDLESLEKTLSEIMEESKKYRRSTEENLMIGSGVAHVSETNLISANDILDETPNFVSSTPHFGSLIQINKIEKTEDRFLLLGGLSGFLYEMKKHNITPGIETFTTLLDVIPSTISAEKQIVSMIRKIGLKVDIDFFNILIKKRSLRFDYEGARSVLTMIKTAKLKPNIMTYGVLSLGCQTQEEARLLLEEMKDKNIRMNIQILGTMLRQGCSNRSFPYIEQIMRISLDEKIKPNEQFLRHLYTFKKYFHKLILNEHPLATDTIKQQYNGFRKYFKNYLRVYDINDLKLEDAIKKIKGSPFQQFKENQVPGFEVIKNEELRRKNKQRKYISKIKPDMIALASSTTSNIQNINYLETKNVTSQ